MWGEESAEPVVAQLGSGLLTRSTNVRARDGGLFRAGRLYSPWFFQRACQQVLAARSGAAWRGEPRGADATVRVAETAAVQRRVSRGADDWALLRPGRSSRASCMSGGWSRSSCHTTLVPRRCRILLDTGCKVAAVMESGFIEE